MSGPGETKAPQVPPDEPFLERWSRRKKLAREGVDDEPEETAVAEPVQAAPAPAAPTELPELPDIDSLGEESDYSAFMAPGVDESLRRQALRKLFSSAKFNVCDGLDDYCEDFTQWVPLGGVITADMRHHLERAARLAEQLGETAAPGEEGEPGPETGVAAAAQDPGQEPAGEDDMANETERDA